MLCDVAWPRVFCPSPSKTVRRAAAGGFSRASQWLAVAVAEGRVEAVWNEERGVTDTCSTPTNPKHTQ